MLQRKEIRQPHTLLLLTEFFISFLISLISPKIPFLFLFPLRTKNTNEKKKKKSGWLQLDEPGELGPSSDALHFE
jgi:hypothetical protein